MNKIISIILSLITAFAASVGIGAESIFDLSYIENITDSDITEVTSDAGYVKDTVLLFFDEDANVFEKTSVLLNDEGITAGIIKELNLYVIKTEGKNLEELNTLCEKLMQNKNVNLASICPAKKLTEQYTPNDPFNDEKGYWESDWNDEKPDGNNWHIEATDTRSAWGYKALFSHMNIGVVDGGFDTEHEELKGRITFPTAREERRNRPNHHGTHVAGIIAAEQDNNVGISGICADSTLVCVDWSPSDGQLWIPDLAVLQALSRVVKGGAKVINFSVGNSSSMGDENYKFPDFIPNLDALLYSYSMGSLLSKGYDFVVVQSSGNGNGEGHAVDASQNGLFSPITEKNAFLPFADVTAQDVLDRIIIVGNAKLTDNGYVQSASSNIGDRVDICAPGDEIYSSVKNNEYLRKSGTSMSAPVVTGIASLVWSVDETLTGAEVKKLVCENTKDVVSPTEDRFFDHLNFKEYPMVNAKFAVEAALRQKGNFYDISVETDGKKEITFENESGQQFVFETKTDGTLNCVLESGNYTVKTELTTTEITVNENTLIEI
ncbi:MAG: S8 family serine peptidase [Clostridia bacterium]|nr:S8 family serine peptidase [Clostridia bacterium]